jgi:hypothetical protein
MSDTPEARSVGDIPSIMNRDAAGWYLDQTGRFELRYWDGSGWTEHVRTGAREQTDPLVGGAVHVRLGALDPSDRLLDDIATVLVSGRRADSPVPASGDVDAPPRPSGLPTASLQQDVQQLLTPEHWHAKSLAHRAFVSAIIWAVVGLIPIAGSIGVIGGTVTLGAALRARRLCKRSGFSTSRAVDAALLSVLAVAASVANLLVTVQLFSQGIFYEAVVCGLESPLTQCVEQVLRAAGSIVRNTVVGG